MADIRIVPAQGAINVTGSANFKGDGGSSVLFVTGSGQIGAGTTVPDSEFHIVGSGTRFLTLDRSGVRSYDLGVNSSGTFLVTDNSATADRIAISVSGSVGIGTTNPGATLQVEGNTLTLNTEGSAQGKQLYFRYSDGANIQSDSYLYFSTGGSPTEKMRITSAGNVGIGVTAPSYKLEISGKAYASTELQANTAVMNTTTGYASFGSNSGTTPVRVGRDASLNDIIINADGNVGIGITNPTQKFETTGGVRFRSYGAGTYTGTAAYALAVDSSGNIIETANSSLSGTGTANRVAYWTGTSTLAADADFSFDGTNVGIGTTSPIGKLQIAGTSGNLLTVGTLTNDWVGDVAIGITNGNGVIISKVNTANDTNRVLVFYRDDTNGATIWGYTPSGTGTDVGFQIRANASSYFNGGNVGIGTASPGYKLHVSGGSEYIEGGFGTNTATAYTATNRLIFNNDYSDSARGPNKITLYDSSWLGGFGIHNDTLAYYTGGTHKWYQATNASNANHLMTLNSSGNLGLGTTSPSAKLQVAGDVLVDGKITAREFHTTFVSASIIYQSGSTQFGNSSDDTHVFTGCIGVGTTPRTALTLNQANVSYAGQLQIASSDYAQITFYNSSALTPGVSNRKASLMYNVPNSTFEIANQITNGHLILQGSDSGGGSVGIGTDSPKQKLDVAGAGGKIAITNTGTTDYSELMFYEGASIKAEIWVNGSGQTNYAGANSMNIWQGSNAPMAFYTNGTNERMRIAADGNVGIGITNPGAKLTVAGNVRINGNIDYSAQVGITQPSSGNALNITNQSDADLTFYVTPSAAATKYALIQPSVTSQALILNTQGGNVGIGITTPGARLTTYVGSGAITGTNDGLRLQVSSYNTGARNTIAWHQDSSDLNLGRFGLEWKSSTSQMNFVWRDMYNGGAGSTELMRLQADGNLGLGTSTPGYKLEVNGTIGAGRITTTGLYGPSTTGNIPIWQYDSSNTGYGIIYAEGSPDTLRIDVSGNALTGTPDFLVGENYAQINGNTVWHAGNDGAGSGLDADTLDGIDGGSFLRSDADDSFSGDLTSAQSKWIKFYHSAETDSNDGKIGSGVFGTGLNIVGTQTSAGTGRQVRIWGDVIDSSGNKFWTAGNDGAGSGLDADLLDGQHGSYYTNASNINAGTISDDYLPATISSNITGNAATATNVAWTGVTAGERTNYTLGFEPADNTSSYAGFYFSAPGGSENGGYFLIRGGADNDVYTQNGITLVADAGWLTLAQRTASDKGIRFMTGATSTTRMTIANGGNVGIASTSPGYKLDVSGDINFSNTLKFAGVNVIHNSSTDVYLNARVLYSNSTLNDGMYINYNSTSAGAAHLRFFANSTNERMRIDAGNGHVGIGTTTPLNRLEVSNGAGSIGYSGNDFVFANAYGKSAFYHDSGNYVYWYSDRTITFYPGGSRSVTFTTGGNVGIGPVNPTRNLDVAGDVRILSGSNPVNFTSAWSSTPDAVLNVSEISNDTVGYQQLMIIGNKSQGSGNRRVGVWDQFQVAGASFHQTFNVNGTSYFSSNVGIGTTSPATKLHVYSSGGGLELNTGATTTLEFIDRANTAATVNTAFYTRYGYFSWNIGGYSEAMRITGAGNVGIGITNPSYKLEVYGNAAFATNSGGVVVGSYDSNTASFKPSVANGSILISDDSGALTRGTEFLNGGGIVVQSLAGFNPLDVKTDGSSLLFVSASGNTGIGVTGPEYLLDLGTLNEENTTDKIRFNANNAGASGGGGGGVGGATGGGTTQGSGIIWKPNYTGYSKRSAGILQIGEGNYFRSGLAFYVNNVADTSTDWSEAMRIASNGNIGIGITAPAARLEIASAAGSNDEKLQRWTYYAPTPTSYYLDLKQTVTSSVVRYNFSMVNANTAYNDVLVLDRGNVGIGTTNPAGKLDVRAGSGGRIIFGSYNADYYAAFEGGDQLNFYNGASNATGYINYNGPSAVLLGRNLHVEGNSSGGTTGAVRINSNGNVGIGTTAPTYQFHLQGSNLMATFRNSSTSANQYTQLEFIAGSRDAYIWLGNQSTTSWAGDGGLNIYTGTGNMDFWTAATQRVRIDSTGNMGVGTLSPVEKLDVNGGIVVRGANYIWGGVTTTLGSWATRQYSNGAAYTFNVNGFEINNTGYASPVNTWLKIDSNGNTGIGTTSPRGRLDVHGGITLRNSRVSALEKHPVGHYSFGETVFEIDPTWTEAQLQDFFNSAYVSWTADSTAPGGYAIQIDGAVDVGGEYNSGFPYIPVDSSQDDWYYMECYIRNEAGSTINHYMGGIDYDQNFSSLGGNPGSYTYNVMSNYNPGTSWTKVYGYWNGFGNSYGSSGTGNTNNWESGTKYFTPQALFNYSFSAGTRRCFISGWKCVRVRATGNRYYTDNVLVNGSVGIGTTNPATKLDVNGIASFRGASSSTDNIRMFNTDGNYAYIRTTAASNSNNTWFDATLGATIWLGWDNPGQARTSNTYSQVYIGTGRGTLTESTRVYRGDIEGNDSSEVVKYRIVGTGALGSHTFFNTGNVGIGLTNPSAPLHIYRAGSSFLNIQAGGGDVAYVQLSTPSSGEGYVIKNLTTGNGLLDKSLYLWNTVGPIQFVTNNTAANAVTVTTGGSIGIGTTAPTNGSKLEVRGSGIWDGGVITLTNSGTSGRSWSIFSTNSSFDQGAGKLLVYNTTAGTNSMVIDSSDNIGIGTTNPITKVDIRGQVYVNNGASNALYIDTAVADNNTRDAIYLYEDDGQATGRQAISWYNGNGGGGSYYKARLWTQVGSSYTATVFGIDVANDAQTVATRLAIRNGNVGIGSITPAYALDVSGTIRATGDVIAYSDARVKENIVTLENSLELVQKLRGVSYNKIGESEKKIGVIAQEVLEVLPEVVSQDSEGTYSVAYGNITAVLIEAIKQQQLQIDELKAEIKQLKG